MIMNPKVSVIIPAYNTEKYIAKAIQSALDQTEKNIEVIVIDDASTDQTINVVQGFSDSRIKLFKNESNQGVSYSRNRAIHEAKGEWVIPLDADDWYAPERIEKLLQIAEERNADLVADNLYFVSDETDQPTATLFSVDRDRFSQIQQIDATTFIKLNMQPAQYSPHLGLTKPLIKREFLTRNGIEYNQDLQVGEDFLLYMTCLLKGAKFIVIPESYYYYRRYREDSTSTQQRKLKVLNQFRHANLCLLKQQEISQIPHLRKLLNQYISKIDRDINYYRITQLIKDKGLRVAIKEILKDFELMKLAVQQAPRFIERHFSDK